MSLLTFAGFRVAAFFCEEALGWPVAAVEADVDDVPSIWGDVDVVLAFTTGGDDVDVVPAFPVAGDETETVTLASRKTPDTNVSTLMGKGEMDA